MCDGARWVYKSQREPTLEADFYANIVSPVLPKHRVLTRTPPYSTIIFEYVDAPTLGTLPLTEEAALAHGRAIVECIGGIEYDAAVYIDVGTVQKWRRFVDSTLGALSGLVADGRFVRSRDADVRAVAAWAGTPNVLRAIEETSRLVHGDATGENVFFTADGYKIIDWQRPQRGPADVDLVAFLDSVGVDPLRHVDPAVVGVKAFMHLSWAVEAKTNLLPHLGLFDHWAEGSLRRIRGVT